MRNKKWKAEVFTIPNLLSVLRLVLIPVYMYFYINAREPWQFHTAGAILTISCLTDAIDGKIARHFHMVSVVGKILDPLADKITQFSLILCLAFKYPVLKSVMLLFAMKETFQIVLGIIYLKQGKMLPGAIFAGKMCTAVLFVSLTVLVFFPNIHPNAVTAIALVDTTFLCISFLGYCFAYLGRYKKVQNIKPE